MCGVYRRCEVICVSDSRTLVTIDTRRSLDSHIRWTLLLSTTNTAASRHYAYCVCIFTRQNMISSVKTLTVLTSV